MQSMFIIMISVYRSVLFVGYNIPKFMFTSGIHEVQPVGTVPNLTPEVS